MESSSKGSNKSKSSDDIAFSEAEDHAVELINKVADNADEANRAIGEIVAGLVEEQGGTKYGAKTLGRLARHPELMCSVEHLRRCWQYHRLLVRYGKELNAAAPTLSYSHHYQLSRLLDIQDEEEQHVAVMAMAAQAVGEKFTATKLQNYVSAHLASIGRAIKGKPKDEKADNGTKEVTEDNAYEALINISKTVVTNAELIVDYPGIKRVADLKLAASRLGLAYVQLVKKLVTAGDDDVVAEAKKVGAALAAAVEPRTESEGGCQNDSN